MQFQSNPAYDKVRGYVAAAGLSLPEDHQTGRPNCGLVAMAIATGENLATATEAYAQAHEDYYGYRQNASWRGRTHDWLRERALRAMGYDVDLKCPPRRMTLKTWVEKHTARDVTYIVVTTGHAQVVRNNWVFDQDGGYHIDDAKWRRGKMVRNIVTITKKEVK